MAGGSAHPGGALTIRPGGGAERVGRAERRAPHVPEYRSRGPGAARWRPPGRWPRRDPRRSRSRRGRYSRSRWSAFATSRQGREPVPGVPRSFSATCRCTRRRPAARSASPTCFSSMPRWKTSSARPTDGMIDALDQLERLRRRVEEAGLEPIERLHAEHHASVGGVLAESAQRPRHLLDVARPLRRGGAPAAADRGVEGAGHGRRAECLRHVDARAEIAHSLVGLARHEQVAARPDHGADRDRRARARARARRPARRRTGRPSRSAARSRRSRARRCAAAASRAPPSWPARSRPTC